MQNPTALKLVKEGMISRLKEMVMLHQFVGCVTLDSGEDTNFILTLKTRIILIFYLP